MAGGALGGSIRSVDLPIHLAKGPPEVCRFVGIQYRHRGASQLGSSRTGFVELVGMVVLRVRHYRQVR
jgi:hypothetical protein